MLGHGAEFFDRACEPERHRGQPELVGRKAPQSLAIQAEPGGTRGRKHLDGCVVGSGNQGVGGDFRRIGDHVAGLLRADPSRQRVGVGVLPDDDHRGAETCERQRQVPAGASGDEEENGRTIGWFSHREYSLPDRQPRRMST